MLDGDVPLDEEIVTNDAGLRWFQYRIVGGGVPVESHLGTVDVLDQGGSAPVVDSTEVTPDEVVGTLPQVLLRVARHERSEHRY